MYVIIKSADLFSEMVFKIMHPRVVNIIVLTIKLCGANEAQRSLRPNERIVISDISTFHN